MSKLDREKVEDKSITFEIGKWAQAWLADDRHLGAFTVSRFRFDEQDHVEFINKLRIFSADILERKLAEDKYPAYFHYKVPASWWQLFKREKAPHWFVKRFPVQWEDKQAKYTVNVTRKATYPMADIVVPDNMGTAVIKDLVSPLNFYEDEDE